MTTRRKAEFTLEEFAQAENWSWQAFKLYQKAQDAAEILHEVGKDLLAHIMNTIEAGMTEKVSESKLERMARDSKEWQAHRKGEFEAKRKAGEAKVKYFSATRLFDCVQSGLSYKRAEMARLNG